MYIYTYIRLASWKIFTMVNHFREQKLSSGYSVLHCYTVAHADIENTYGCNDLFFTNIRWMLLQHDSDHERSSNRK